MADAPEASRPSQLWKALPADRRRLAADAFWQDENAGAEQAEVLAAIAQRIKFRLKSVLAMPPEKKTHYLLTSPTISEAAAARLLVAYHLAHQRPMMARFLDELGIAHEDGLIADDELQAPPPDRLAAAARTIATQFPAADVALYLSTLQWQDPDAWGGLATLSEARAAAPSPA